MKNFERINLMTTITQRGFRDRIIEGFREIGVTYNMATVGESQGGLSISDYLGLQDDEIDVIFSVVSDSKADRAMAFIEYSSYRGSGDKGRAVAALVPISGISGPLALEYISGPVGRRTETGGRTMTETVDKLFSLIVTVVSKGYADLAIAAAKEAGARGGTVLYARGSGVHETEKFLNISIEPEKEIVLTIVKTEDVKTVITSITEQAGLKKPGAGISFVLPVLRIAGLTAEGIERGEVTAADVLAAAEKEAAQSDETEPA